MRVVNAGFFVEKGFQMLKDCPRKEKENIRVGQTGIGKTSMHDKSVLTFIGTRGCT
jgi:hypothetical protein